MENQKEIAKINRFLCMVLPIVVRIVRKILESFECEVRQEGNGLDLAFNVKKGEKEVKFYLHNLFLEIATLDRDENPLRFDENLQDFDYFLAKTARVVESKLNVLFHVFSKEDIDAAIESISQNAKQYERIRIWKFDKFKE